MKSKYIFMSFVAFLLSFYAGELIAFPVGKWYGEQNSDNRTELQQSSDGTLSFGTKFPGSGLIYQEFNRSNFRLSREEFMRVKLSIEVAISDGNGEPVNGTIFIKDKDGLWFQSRKEFQISPTGWQLLEVDLSADGGMIPLGHGATWNSQYLSSMLAAGVSLYSNINQNITVRCRNLRFSGHREFLPLNVINWQITEVAMQNQMFQSDFNLSREYYNPYDPDEVEVNVEICGPGGIKKTFPAFFTQDFTRRRHFTREINLPAGRHYWAFRFTPPCPGEYLLRLSVTDMYGPNKIYSEWKKIQVKPSSLPGFVRVSQRDRRYLEFSSGEFFFPVGINIHTNIDLRSERQFRFGHLPDRGTFDYDEYWAALSANGVNAAEVWMASWSFALEWNSSQPYYYGLGRYNLANAWRLDHVLNDAAAKGIYIHLTLDNHGKLSGVSDQEWEDNPFNINNSFSVANAGLFAEPEEFFTNSKAAKYNRQRNRYIAGRWGAYTNIFGIEFWSEVNLVGNFEKIYASGEIDTWHRNAVLEFREFDQGNHLLTTHYCGDYLNLLKYSRLIEMRDFDYVAGDAYRHNNIHFVDQMRWHGTKLNVFKKPLLTTEFGGTAMAGKPEQVVGDIHSGLWSAFFKSQACVPFLWWHDFIHLNNHYPHYRGFTTFIKGIDWRGDTEFRELPVFTGQLRSIENSITPSSPVYFALPPVWNLRDYFMGKVNGLRLSHEEYFAGKLFGRNNYFVECFSGGNANRVYGWVFTRLNVFSYPEKSDLLPWWRNVKVDIDYPLSAGIYRLRCYETVTGMEQSDNLIWLDNNQRIITMPSFQIDVAFKLERQSFVEKNLLKQLRQGQTDAYK